MTKTLERVCGDSQPFLSGHTANVSTSSRPVLGSNLLSVFSTSRVSDPQWWQYLTSSGDGTTDQT